MENEKVNIKKELLLTLSNQKSLFSSKKIERFVVFYTFLIINIVYIGVKISEMNTSDLMQLTALWLAYAGYNSYQNYKDRKLEENT